MWKASSCSAVFSLNESANNTTASSNDWCFFPMLRTFRVISSRAAANMRERDEMERDEMERDDDGSDLFECCPGPVTFLLQTRLTASACCDWSGCVGKWGHRARERTMLYITMRSRKSENVSPRAGRPGQRAADRVFVCVLLLLLLLLLVCVCVYLALGGGRAAGGEDEQQDELLHHEQQQQQRQQGRATALISRAEQQH